MVGCSLKVFSHMDIWVMNLIICLIVAGATEITSNSATATLLMPIMAELVNIYNYQLSYIIYLSRLSMNKNQYSLPLFSLVEELMNNTLTTVFFQDTFRRFCQPRSKIIQTALKKLPIPKFQSYSNQNFRKLSSLSKFGKLIEILIYLDSDIVSEHITFGYFGEYFWKTFFFLIFIS